jgi:hypothetical protein
MAIKSAVRHAMSTEKPPAPVNPEPDSMVTPIKLPNSPAEKQPETVKVGSRDAPGG